MTQLELHPRKAQQVERNRPLNATAKEPKAPYFYYRDFSDLRDPDPSKPVTAPGRIPNFPAKMMAILSRPDLSHIVSWLPHGRSWKVHKPREFECKVIPTYFEHSKFSSFIRQANGWGFRRMISKGPDRNSYYHEMFLRGQPHLIKLMKRPTSTTRPQADANTEPDFYRISEENPLPEAKIEQDGLYDDRAHHEPKYHSYSPENFMPQESVSPLPGFSSSSAHYDPSPEEPYSVYYPHQSHYSEPLLAAPTSSRSVDRVESYPPTTSLPSQVHSMAPVARAVSPVLSHLEPPEHHHSPLPIFVPENQWTETCLEPSEMPRDFEDPFAGGLTPIDFW